MCAHEMGNEVKDAPLSSINDNISEMLALRIMGSEHSNNCSGSHGKFLFANSLVMLTS